LTGNQSAYLSKNRLEAMTDGFYAIVITIGVLTINDEGIPPIPPGGTFLDILMPFLPAVLNYAIAFFILATFWIIHYRQTRSLQHVDNTYIWLNFIGLFFVALIPFTISINTGFNSYPLAVSLLAINLMVIGIFGAISWAYASWNHRLIEPDVSQERIDTSLKRSLTTPFVCLLVVIFAFTVSPENASWLYLLIFPLLQMLSRPKKTSGA